MHVQPVNSDYAVDCIADLLRYALMPASLAISVLNTCTAGNDTLNNIQCLSPFKFPTPGQHTSQPTMDNPLRDTAQHFSLLGQLGKLDPLTSQMGPRRHVRI